jgi:protein FRG1
MVKPLTFKGDKKSVKKRKRAAAAAAEDDPSSSSQVARRRTDDNDDGAVATTAAAAAAAEQDDDSWVSAEAVTDVVGPVMIVLPTEKPSALACDPNGKVFTIPIENIVDGNPASAEPHDVRQVWVANRVSGTESFRFKGHHGR